MDYTQALWIHREKHLVECPSENSFQKSCREGEDGQNRERGRQVAKLGSTDQPEPRALRCDIGGDQVTVTELRQHTLLTASAIPEQEGIRDKNKYSFLQSSLSGKAEKAKTGNCVDPEWKPPFLFLPG